MLNMLTSIICSITVAISYLIANCIKEEKTSTVFILFSIILASVVGMYIPNIINIFT